MKQGTRDLYSKSVYFLVLFFVSATISCMFMQVNLPYPDVQGRSVIPFSAPAPQMRPLPRLAPGGRDLLSTINSNCLSFPAENSPEKTNQFH